jgi:hypothetical protein
LALTRQPPAVQQKAAGRETGGFFVASTSPDCHAPGLSLLSKKELLTPVK